MKTSHLIEEEELMAYVDGELSPRRAGAVAAHLEGCTECRDAAADLREVSQQLAASTTILARTSTSPGDGRGGNS